MQDNYFNRAVFIRGAHQPSQFPEDSGVEVAFAGRSNAGKSSALNALTGISGLARTSKTPGRTREINFFSLDRDKHLVDLPGYGYAKVPEGMRRQWAATVDRYMESRVCLRGIVLVMDIRHPYGKFDRRLIQWCSVADMPLHILLTKMDKLSRGRAATVLREVLRNCDETDARLTAQLFSSLKKIGVDKLRRQLNSWMSI